MNAVLLNDHDTVVTVTSTIEAGEDIIYVFGGTLSIITAASNLPIYHKAAVKNVKKGDGIIKYGERIGYATADIKVGEHVHSNNLNSRIQG